MTHLSRRSFLQLKSASDKPISTFGNSKIPSGLSKSSLGINAYTGPWDNAAIIHLCRRTLFGVTKEDIAFFASKSMSQSVDYLLNIPAAAPSPPLNHYGNNPNSTDTDVLYGQTWVNAPANPNLDAQRRQSLKSWWMQLIIQQDRNLREKMTLFLHNHFATEMASVKESRFLYKHHALLRANCLGNFKNLIKSITTDPAMLLYLNGDSNNKTSPDENYGRELQELFTVGKDLPNHYTEDDVKAAARVLTGWQVNRTAISSAFNLSRHDTGNKTFSSFYSNRVITGRNSTTAGQDELNDLVDMIFSVDEVSNYICRKLYRYFVYYIIDETVEANVIKPLAKIFRDSNYELAPVVSTLLKSEHFFDTLNRGCMIKSPVDYVAGYARQFSLVFPDASDTLTQYTHYGYAQYYAAILSQDMGDPPNVAGWPAYYETPQYYELWINSDSLPKRNQMSDALIYNGYTRQGYTLKVDLLALVKTFSNPSDPNALLTEMIQLFYGQPISASSQNTLKISFLLSGQTNDVYWTSAWSDYINNPTNTQAKNTVNTRLQSLFKYVIGQAEHQLC